MSHTQTSLGGYSGYDFEFETVEQTKLIEGDSLFKSELEKQLEREGIAKVPITLSADDFAFVSDAYAACIQECPELLATTFHNVDRRFGNEAGHVRKERKLSPATQRQIQDPKNLFHFNEQASVRWQEQYRLAPAEMRAFLDAGQALQSELMLVARLAISQLEETHPGITNAHYPKNSLPVSFLRVVRYDAYTYDESMAGLAVAKTHRDIGGYTLQAYADAPGFWGRTPDGKQYFEDHLGLAYFFAGASHEKIYGKSSRIKPLIHGVDRVAAENGTYIPERTAAILFIDPWKIDCKVKPEDAGSY